MKGKHTKGNWVITATSPTCETDIKSGEKRICEVKHYSNFKDDPSAEEGLANAKLIAAAPDLLENLQRLLDRINEDNLAENFPASVRRAEEAIRKATE